MVSLLQPAGQSPPSSPHTTSQPSDFDVDSDLSFNEVLKARAKKEQKEVSNSMFTAVSAMAGATQAIRPEVVELQPAPVAAHTGNGRSISSVSSAFETVGKAFNSIQPVQNEAVGPEANSKQQSALAASGSAEGAHPAGQKPVDGNVPPVTGPSPDAPATPYQALQSSAEAQLAQSAAELAKNVNTTGNVETRPSTASAQPGNGQAAAPANTVVVPAETQKVDLQGVPVVSPPGQVTALSGAQAGTVDPGQVAAVANAVPSVLPETASAPVPNTSTALGAMAATNLAPAVSAPEMPAAGKVSVPGTVAIESTDVVQQVLRQMSVNLQNGSSSMRLQLNPKELGAIDVQMVKNSQGVSVTFFAEQAGTGRLLETQLDQLRQSLTNSGIQLSNLNIGQHGQFGQQGNFYKQAYPFAQQTIRAVAQEEASPDLLGRTRIERLDGQPAGVDYHV